jgi:5-methylcytosine-specific restriction endonuclease McrA
MSAVLVVNADLGPLHRVSLKPIDHVLPRSRGGRNTWTNTIPACQGCNGRKGDRTPAEAGMVPRTEPTAPSWAALTAVALR